jgi:hypothetical protein
MQGNYHCTSLVIVRGNPFKLKKKTDEVGKLAQVSGAENLPEPLSKRPILFVGNHTLFGLYDCPVLIQELYLRGFKVRGLAHRSHWMSGVGML